MALHQRVKQNDSFDVVEFLWQQRPVWFPEVSKVIWGTIQFLEADDTEAMAKKKKKTAELSRKLRQADAFETMEPKMRKLQKKLAEGALVH